MATHVWTVLCGRAVVDNQTNSLTLADIHEEVQIAAMYEGDAPDLSSTPIPYNVTVVTLMERDEEHVEEPSCEIHLRLIGPDGKRIAAGLGHYALSGPHKRSRVISKMQLPIRQSGRHEIHILVPAKRGLKKVATVPVAITLLIRKATPADVAARAAGQLVAAAAE